jgi:hypothetical protein
MNAIQIRDLISTINKREQTVEELAQNTKKAATDFLLECGLQGLDLARIQAATPFGQWQALFTSGKIKVSYQRAMTYIKVGRCWDRANLDEAKSLNHAIRLITVGEQLDKQNSEQGKPAPRKWPPIMETFHAATRLASLAKKCPFDEWTEVERDGLRERLVAVVKSLWPEAKIN